VKKNVRPLRLGRETVLHLTAGPLRYAAAAAPGRAVVVQTVSQDGGASCVQSCYFNTCYDTCAWEPVAGLN
jgi:hypothetical protein